MDKKRQALRALAIDRPSRRSAILVRCDRRGRPYDALACRILHLLGQAPIRTLAQTGAKEAATRISIAAGSPAEFRFKLSKVTARRGVVTFVVKNKGHLPHDFKIAGKRQGFSSPARARS